MVIATIIAKILLRLNFIKDKSAAKASKEKKLVKLFGNGNSSFKIKNVLAKRSLSFL